MTETVSGAVDVVQAPSRLIEANLVEFGKTLPAHIGAEKFGRWSLSMIKNALRNPDIQQAWERVLSTDAGRLSVMGELMTAASLGLEPGREYYVVPFGATAGGIVGYRGEVRLITNARPCTVVAQLVREGDKFHMRGANVPPLHEPPDPDDASSWFDDTRPVVGAYSYVAYPGGECSMVERMSEAAIAKRRAVAKTQKIWSMWEDEMRLKTVTRPLRKSVPWSAERLWGNAQAS
jgi:recombinational DNA repair protein RecT